MGKAPCIHGDLCRAYMRKFGYVSVKGNIFDRQLCIYSVDCPNCEFYQPKNVDKDLRNGYSVSMRWESL